jgi:lipoprotein-anchoring transpeptidase ErfK/SrfK
VLPRLIVVDREERRLDLYTWRLRKRRYVRTFTALVTVGKLGAETPHGLYFVQGKSRTPAWQMPPNPDYPEEQWGTVFKYGEPGNPFDGGFISLAGRETGIGLHGTSFDPQVGTASSHGCVRLRVADLLKLYDQCKTGTPVYLH